MPGTLKSMHSEISGQSPPEMGSPRADAERRQAGSKRTS